MRLERRGFLRTLLLGLAGLAGVGPPRWLAAHAEAAGGAAPAEPDGEAGHAEPGREAESAGTALFSADSRRLLGRLADVIVPEWQGRPSAGTDEFLSRFEALARETPGRVETYGRHFDRFVEAVASQVPSTPDPPDSVALTALFEGWHREWQTQPAPSFAAQFFEMLRRDVFRTYYASPAGWKAVGFTGPAHRVSPDGHSPT
jgi:hypothetical protein